MKKEDLLDIWEPEWDCRGEPAPWIEKCPECGYSGQAVQLDYGIGAYEFWGFRGVHHAYCWVCPKCEALVEDLD